MRIRAATLASALVPGLGQLLVGRFSTGLLFLLGATWLHGFLGAHGPKDGRTLALILGAPAIERGFHIPVVVLFTLLALALHVAAALEVRQTERQALRADTAGR